MIFVLAVSATNTDLARALLPRTECVAAGGGRVYLVYETARADDAGNFTYTDVDGEPLIDCRAFGTLVEADAWVRDDMRRVA